LGIWRDVFIYVIVDCKGIMRVMSAEKWGVKKIGRDRWIASRMTARARAIVMGPVSSEEARPLIAGARYPA
jgi:hypothetical protein